MLRMLKSVDISPAEVMIEATIAEVTLNDQLKLGVRYFLSKGGNNFNFAGDSDGVTNAVVSSAISGAFPGFNYFLNAGNFKILLNTLSSITNVDVLSTPTLTVIENKKALLQVGDEVPIVTQTATSVVTSTPAIVNSVSYRSTGVILGITPRVSDDGHVVLEIEQEVSTPVTTTTSTTQESPTIQERRVKTTVSVNNGQTIVLAGLTQDNSSRGRSQIPILGDVPLIGNVFKDKDDHIQRTELLIAITPQVIRDSSQIDSIADELRDQINLSTRPQRGAPPDHREQVDRLVR
jgi:general secretion pathway protein D